MDADNLVGQKRGIPSFVFGSMHEKLLVIIVNDRVKSRERQHVECFTFDVIHR